jgi:hypothetical protein
MNLLNVEFSGIAGLIICVPTPGAIAEALFFDNFYPLGLVGARTII